MARLGLPPVQGMAECLLVPRSLPRNAFGIAPRPRDGRIDDRSNTFASFGIAPRPRDGKIRQLRLQRDDFHVWDCPPSKGWQNGSDLPRCLKRLGLPPVQGMAKWPCLWQRMDTFGIAPRPRDGRIALALVSVVWDCPRPRDGRIQSVFGIAPRPRDGRIDRRKARCGAVWDCPPSKGWQNISGIHRVCYSLGLPPSKGWQNLASECTAFVLFGIAPRPRDGKIWFGVRQFGADVWDCPPSKGWQNRWRICRRNADVWDCPPSKGWQNYAPSGCTVMLFQFGIAPRPRDGRMG